MMQADLLKDAIEPNFIRTVRNCDGCRHKWVRMEQELASCQESLARSETQRRGLEDKLEYAHHQVKAEIRRRQKAEAECDKLEQQMQLFREIVFCEESTNIIQQSEEQPSTLAFLSTNCEAAADLNASRRVTTTDASSSNLSDISSDQTDDSFDRDSPRATARVKRLRKRNPWRNHLYRPPSASKPLPATGRTSELDNEALVTKTVGRPVEAVSTLETGPYWAPSRGKTATMDWDSESITS